MNEISILEGISEQDIALLANNDEHLGFKAVDWFNIGNNHDAILMSTRSNKFYKIRYEGWNRGVVKEVERKERTETIVYYQEIIR